MYTIIMLNSTFVKLKIPNKLGGTYEKPIHHTIQSKGQAQRHCQRSAIFLLWHQWLRQINHCPKRDPSLHGLHLCARHLRGHRQPAAGGEATDTDYRKATEHPLYSLLHDEPNSEMTLFMLWEVMLAHLLIYGNSYCQIIRTG